jgi:hypothetical protein
MSAKADAPASRRPGPGTWVKPANLGCGVALPGRVHKKTSQANPGHGLTSTLLPNQGDGTEKEESAKALVGGRNRCGYVRSYPRSHVSEGP